MSLFENVVIKLSFEVKQIEKAESLNTYTTTLSATF